MNEFDEYIVYGEPGQKKKVDAWQTVIGLQNVDGLKVSPIYSIPRANTLMETFPLMFKSKPH